MSLPPSFGVRSRLCAASLLLLAAAGPLFGAKVRLSNDDLAARALAFPGQDYGTFRVVEVDEATANALAAAGLGEKLLDADVVHLNSGPLDTTRPAVRALRTAATGFTGKRLHLVQFAGPIKQEWVDALEADGLRVVTYIPNNAYLVWGEAKSIGAFQGRALDAARSAVQWEAAWRDEWKLAPSVFADAKRPAAEMFSVQLVEDKAANDATLAALKAAGAIFVREPWTAPGYLNFAVQLPAVQLGVLAARADVVSVHRYVVPKLRDEAQAMVLAGALTGNGPTPGNYFSTLAGWGFGQAVFDASGFAVDVSDDGFDNGTTTPNHFVLYRRGDKTQASRLIYRVTQGTAGSDAGQGNSGHGQLNGSIIGGYVPDNSVTVGGNTTATTGFPHADAQGFRYGLGVAPFVKLGNSTIFDSPAGTFTNPNYNTLQSAAYAAGARLSSNSWGANVAGAYNTESQAYDNLVRDAQTGTAGNQQMVIVFSAGNDGPGATTIGSPGTGKNVITVGAAEGVRSHATAVGGVDAEGNDGCGIYDGEANSANDIIGFSSRGPCTDGRVKPDIMAGGTHITGITYVTATSTQNGTAAATYRASGVCALPGHGTTASLSNFFPQGEQWYTTSSGTSHSTPAVAGAAALVYQQFINNPAYLGLNRTPAGSAPPSPALVKAYLMNSARYMNGVGANDQLPSNSQGMGHANLGTAFDGVFRAIRDQVAGDRFTATGQRLAYSGTITDGTKPFRVTLAWTDKSGPTAGNAYVNDLDLIVTVGGKTYRGNAFAATGGLSVPSSTSDARNNVESVFLPAGTTGSYTVTILAANVAGQADPTVTGNNQDFALVVYNSGALSSAASTGPILSAGAATLGTGSILLANACNTLSVPFTNVGSSAATAISATLTSSTSGVTVTQGTSAYPNLAAGASGANATPFQVSTAASVPCGTNASFTLTLTYAGGGSPAVTSFTIPVGAIPAYTFTSTTGATIPAGGTLVPFSQADERSVPIVTPAGFSFSVCGTPVPGGSTITAHTNGTLHIANYGGVPYTTAALPTAAAQPNTAPTIFVFWDDLDLSATTATNGIYTSLTGSAPNRLYTIQWRGVFYNTSVALNFAVQFRENSSTFDLLYLNAAGNAGSGIGATIGVQAAASGAPFTQFSRFTASVPTGTRLTATLDTCVGGSGPCAAGAITNGPPPSPVIVGTPYSFAYTATGNPTPTFALSGGTLPPGLSLSTAGVLSGTATSAGTGSFSGITVTASNGNTPNATQTFSLSAVTRSANYLASYGLTGNNALPAADPNGDGVANLLAYALGLSPIVNAGVYDHGTVRNYAGTNYLSIRFNRSSVATDLTYIVEASSDLGATWTELARSTAGGAMTASGGVMVSDAGGPPTYATEVRDAVPVPPTPSNEKRFIRLRVTSP